MKSINKIDFDVKFENVKKEDYLVAQVELNRLRVKYIKIKNFVETAHLFSLQQK